MSEDEKTACMLLGDLGLVDSIGYVSRVVAYLKAEREACARECDAMAHGSITAIARDNCADMATIIRARGVRDQ